MIKRLKALAIAIIALVTMSLTTVEASETYFIPEGLGNMHTYTNWDGQSWIGDSRQLINTVGDKITNSYGIVKYGGAFAGATTTSFGNVGDVLLVCNTGGVVYPVCIADIKSQVYCAWDHNPANMWGHYNGKDIVEFEIIHSCAKSLYNGTGWYVSEPLNRCIYKIVNVGSAFENIDLLEPETLHSVAKEEGFDGYLMMTSPYDGYTI